MRHGRGCCVSGVLCSNPNRGPFLKLPLSLPLHFPSYLICPITIKKPKMQKHLSIKEIAALMSWTMRWSHQWDHTQYLVTQAGKNGYKMQPFDRSLEPCVFTVVLTNSFHSFWQLLEMGQWRVLGMLWVMFLRKVDLKVDNGISVLNPIATAIHVQTDVFGHCVMMRFSQKENP